MCSLSDDSDDVREEGEERSRWPGREDVALSPWSSSVKALDVDDEEEKLGIVVVTGTQPPWRSLWITGASPAIWADFKEIVAARTMAGVCAFGTPHRYFGVRGWFFL
jgi:hypothetical protein